MEYNLKAHISGTISTHCILASDNVLVILANTGPCSNLLSYNNKPLPVSMFNPTIMHHYSVQNSVKKLSVLLLWISNHQHKIEENFLKSYRSSSEVVSFRQTNWQQFGTLIIIIIEQSGRYFVTKINGNDTSQYILCCNIFYINDQKDKIMFLKMWSLFSPVNGLN